MPNKTCDSPEAADLLCAQINIHRMLLFSWGKSQYIGTMPFLQALCCKESYVNGAAGWQPVAHSQCLHPKRSLTDLWYKSNFSGAFRRETGSPFFAVGRGQCVLYPGFLFPCNGTNRKEV